MNAERLIKQLEKAISKGQRPEKKIQAHCLLAKLYHRKGDEAKAHKHFTKAKEKFFDMYENGIKRLKMLIFLETQKNQKRRNKS